MSTTTAAWERIPMSWDEYEALGDTVRGEYVDGELIVAPFPNLRHQTIARRLANAIESALPSGVSVAESWGWKPGDDEFGPDVIVFDDTSENIRLTGTPHLAVPHLAVEVLSTDPARDMIRKAAKYAASGLQHYWVIDPDGGDHRPPPSRPAAKPPPPNVGYADGGGNDPDGLEIIEYRLDGSAYIEVARHAGPDPVTLDIGVCQITLVPGHLAD